MFHQLNEATEIASTTQYNRAGGTAQSAEQEIARFHQIQRIGEIVRQYRARVEQMERRLG